MPKYTNAFAAPKFREETVCDGTGAKLGTIRIKPVAIGWKPAGKGSFHMVSLQQFIEWITDPGTRARTTKS